MEGPSGPSAVRKVVVVCPTSLVGKNQPLDAVHSNDECYNIHNACAVFVIKGNWENELKKWVGDHCPTFAVHSDPKKRLRQFIQVTTCRDVSPISISLIVINSLTAPRKGHSDRVL